MIVKGKSSLKHNGAKNERNWYYRSLSSLIRLVIIFWYYEQMKKVTYISFLKLMNWIIKSLEFLARMK